MTEQTPDPDAPFVGIPAGAMDPSLLTPQEDTSYLSSEGPSAVIGRAKRLADKNRRDAAAAVDRVETRLRYLYFCMAVFVVVLGTPVTQSIEHSYHNCQASNVAADKFNKALDALIDTPGIKPETKAARHAQFSGLYASTHHCSGVWPFQP